ncbi:Rieske (2Fe-2S) protein [Subtercola lobariae]|uniref:Cytochrome bc1 complex Rieske iron-sulfur subunit n=1 Tax=Subtercola lobariae TaxID=1588641 RepID=A0A917EX20_9MICO|nr:Rieske (2Fe-2S) protein [Subtercola lobariae]GGF29277.1 iron-sulfur protein [Subtercola lobariae]
MTEKSAITRRVVLTSATVGLAGASAFALAACAPATTSSGSDAQAAPSTAGSAAGSAAPSTSAGASGSTASVAALADIPVGGAKSVTFEGKGLLVGQPTAGSVVAFSSVCPHQGCAVAFAKTDFECPCHGSTFALATGDVTHGPAQSGLTPVAVKVDGDQIVAA